MEKWIEYKLGDIYEVHNGLSKGGKFFGSGFPFLSFSTIFKNWFIPNELTNLVQSTEKEQESYSIKKGDIFVTRTSETADELGMSCVALKDYPKATYNGFCKRIRQYNQNVEIDPRFIGYYLRNPTFRLFFQAFSGSMSTRASLTNEALLGLPLKLPPLPTQQKIAAILSSLDDKIELNNKINENLEQQAQALFDEIFKEDEKDIFLGEVIETTSGGTPSRKNMAFYTNGNNCWIKSKELESGFIIDTEEKITNDAINNSAAKLLPENSVLIAMYGATVGAYGIISKPMTCNQAICALLPNENYPYTYLFMFAKNVTQELETLAVGSAQQNISQVLIKKLKVHSDTKKIKEFHSSTHAIFEQMLLIRQENKTLSELRDTLLPKLMNGEIEV